MYLLFKENTVVENLEFLQQQQRPDLARLMQLHAAGAAGAGLPPGAPAGLPPGLLGGPGAAAAAAANPAAAAAAAAAGLPTSIPALLAGIPSSLAQAGPHPAFASLLAQQKPSLDVPRPKDEELKRAIADTNGSKYHFPETQIEIPSVFLSLLSDGFSH